MEVYAASGLNYVVTAHKPTAVIKSVAGYFTGPKDLNLIVAKSTRLEVHVGSPQGIEAVLELPIYGRISNVELFRPKNYDHDLLFVFLEKYKYCVLEYNANTREVDTLSMGDAHDQVGRPSDSGQLSVIDPLHRCIVLQMYDGMLKIIPMDSSTGRLSEAFNTRLDELQVLDIAMLANKDRPMVSVLYQDNKHGRHLKSFQVSMHQKVLIEDPARHYSEHNLDPGAGLLVPVPAPLGGLLVLGEESILYVGMGPERHSVRLGPCILKAWGRITADGSRVMLSDNQGLMYILVLQNQDGKVTGLKLEIVGRTSSASSLSYLDDGVVYVGSRQGDSQLIRLHANPPDPSAPNSYIQVLQTWPNLGPIVDFSVMDLDRQGQGQLVCCSGVLSDGSLRVVRNGVGINEQASIELTGIRGLWSLRGSYNDPHHKYLVLTFVEESRILAMSEDQELDEVELPGFDANAQTLWCGNSASDLIVQVTAGGVRAIAVDSGMLESDWRAEGDRLDMAAGNATQVVVASKGGRVKLLGLGPHGITQQAEVVVEGEVACVDITPTGVNPLQSSLVAVGTWGMAVQLYAIQQGGGGPDSCQLQLLTSQLTGGDAIPRSIMMWCFEDVPYLLVGLGDGQLHYWRMQPTSGSLHDKKKLVLGSKPVMLRPFKGLAGAKPGELGAADGMGNANGGQGGVFAASDRPAVLYSSHKKILFANLNENEVTYMAPFNCQSYPDSLALAKEGSMTIGTVDAIRKLHIHTVPLQEQPRRIAYQEETHTLGVVTITNFGMEDEANYVRAFDAGGVMELKADFKLSEGEVGQSICSCKLGDTDTATYYVVGTGLVRADEAEPKEGRMLVLQYTQGQLVQVAECKMKGSVYEVLSFHGGRLLSTCNNKVQVHRWIVREDGIKELQLECSAAGHIVSLCLAARGDHVIVGDLMRSIGLYLFKPHATAAQAGALELRAQDYATNWCTAVAMLDDDTYLGAENSHNLFVVRKSADAQTDEERGRLELVGEFHWGEMINRIRPGSLVLRLPDSELAQVPTWLFGTIDGSIGVIASLPPHVFEFLTRLQDAMRKVIRGVGGLSHAEWRRFENERKTADAKGFVDGDLIELFLDLKPEDATKVVSLLGEDMTVEEVTHKVEELARLH